MLRVAFSSMSQATSNTANRGENDSSSFLPFLFTELHCFIIIVLKLNSPHADVYEKRALNLFD